MHRRFELSYTKLNKTNVDKHIFVWSAEAYLEPTEIFAKDIAIGKIRHATGLNEDEIGSVLRFNDVSETIIFYKIKSK